MCNRIYSIFLTVFILVSCTSNSNLDKNDNLEDFDDKEKRNSNWIWLKPATNTEHWVEADSFNSSQYSGDYLKFYDNGHIYSDIKCINGEIDTIRMYDTTGTVIFTKWYTDEKYERTDYEKLGSFEWFHQNLNLRKTGTIQKVDNDELGNEEFLTGTIISYFPNGDTSSVENFIDWQFKHGEFRTWHENGQLKTVENFFTNMRTGTFQEFDLHGILVKDGEFGIAFGKVREYYKGGELQSDIQYYQYLKSGNAKYYSPSGELERTCYYDHDTLVSEKLHITQ